VRNGTFAAAVLVLLTMVSACGADVTPWVAYQFESKGLSFEHPTDINQVIEGENHAYFTAREVTLTEGPMSMVMTRVHVWSSGSPILPPGVDHSDAVALAVYTREWYLRGLDAQLEVVTASRVAEYNGLSGAFTTVHRVAPNETDIVGAIDIYYYFAWVIHGDTLVEIIIDARGYNGGEHIEAYAERFISSIEFD